MAQHGSIGHINVKSAHLEETCSIKLNRLRRPLDQACGQNHHQPHLGPIEMVLRPQYQLVRQIPRLSMKTPAAKRLAAF